MAVKHRIAWPLRGCAGSVLAIVVGSSTWAADVTCAQWSVSGGWTAIQSNHQRRSKGPRLELLQTGTQFKGSAHYLNENGIVVSGPVVGTAVRNTYTATIYWDDSRVGAYSGEIGPQGLVVGRTFDKNDPRTSAAWHADRSFECLRAGTKSVELGRAPASTPTPAVTPSSLCKAAASARARQSPAAPGLERQCREITAAATAPPAAAARSGTPTMPAGARTATLIAPPGQLPFAAGTFNGDAVLTSAQPPTTRHPRAPSALN
ncbi:MAG: hypothetical protein V4792_10970 [Pseudomonadota bacterium]